MRHTADGTTLLLANTAVPPSSGEHTPTVVDTYGRWARLGLSTLHTPLSWSTPDLQRCRKTVATVVPAIFYSIVAIL